MPEMPKVEVPRPLNSFVRIVYVWALVFLGMVIYCFVWFSMGMVVMTFIDAIIASASFSAPWDSVVEFCRTCFLIHPIISLVGWFLYGIINSLRRDVETWRTY
jgi:hypothetical protein